MAEHWVIVGAGSAGCVVANRLSADASRRVTLVDDGPDLARGAVPAGIAGPSFFAAMAEPGRMHDDLLATRAAGIAPTIYQRGRGIGGSSAVNAMVALRGDPELYRSWGWTNCDTAWDLVQIPTEPAALVELGAIDRALLADPRASQLQLTRVGGRRVTAAEAYLWPALTRPNLTVRPHSPVAQVLFNGRAASGVRLVDGTEIAADHVVVAAGAIHSPVILLRSGVDTPGVGLGLQDHPSVVFTLQLRDGVEQNGVQRDGAALPIASALHTTIDNNLIQLLAMSNLGLAPETAGLGAIMAALMTPVGNAGSVGIDAAGNPVIDFAFLEHEHDLHGLAAATKIALDVLESAGFEEIVSAIYIDDAGTTAAALADEHQLIDWLRASCGDYVHATSTCAMGTVVDDSFAVNGYQNLFVSDASIFPAIPDANTHLPTTMAAERFGLIHS